MSVVVWNNGKCKNAWSCRRSLSGSKWPSPNSPQTSAERLATAQQEILQLMCQLRHRIWVFLLKQYLLSAALWKSANCDDAARSAVEHRSWAARACIVKKSPTLVHWKDEMKGTTLNESGSSNLKTLFPRFYPFVLSVYHLFQPLLLGFFCSRDSQRTLIMQRQSKILRTGRPSMRRRPDHER